MPGRMRAPGAVSQSGQAAFTGQGWRRVRGEDSLDCADPHERGARGVKCVWVSPGLRLLIFAGWDPWRKQY